MDENSVIMVKNLKDNSLWVGFYKDFLIEFKKEIHLAKLEYMKDKGDEVELMASEFWCKKYNKDVRDCDLFGESTYLNLLLDMYHKHFEKDLKFNINSYSNDIVIINTFEITLDNYGEIFLEKTRKRLDN